MCSLISDLHCPQFHSRLQLNCLFILQWNCYFSQWKYTIHLLGRERVNDDNTRGFCGQCRSRSDCTECTVWSLIYAVHNFILYYNLIVSSTCNGCVFLADEKLRFIYSVVIRVHRMSSATALKASWALSIRTFTHNTCKEDEILSLNVKK